MSRAGYPNVSSPYTLKRRAASPFSRNWPDGVATTVADTLYFDQSASGQVVNGSYANVATAAQTYVGSAATSAVGSYSNTASATQTYVGNLRVSSSYSNTASATQTYAGNLRVSSSYANVASATQTYAGNLLVTSSYSNTASATQTYVGSAATSAVGSYSNTASATQTYAGNLLVTSSHSNTASATQTYTGNLRVSSSYANVASATQTYVGNLRVSSSYANVASATQTYAGNLLVTLSYSNTASATQAYAGNLLVTSSYSNTASATQTYVGNLRVSSSYANVASATQAYAGNLLVTSSYSNTASATQTYVGNLRVSSSYANVASATQAYAGTAVTSAVGSYSNVASATQTYSASTAVGGAYSNDVVAVQAYSPAVDARSSFSNDAAVLVGYRGDVLVSGQYSNVATISPRRNVLSNSEDFTAASWTRTRASVVPAADVYTPKRIRSASRIVEDASNNSHFITAGGAQIPVQIGQQITVSFVAKADGRNFISLEAGFAALFNGRLQRCDWNLLTGASEFQSAGSSNASSINLGDGWWYCTLTTEPATAAGNNAINLMLKAASTGTRLYQGDGVSGVLLTQVQVDIGNQVRDYQFTVGGSAFNTRGFSDANMGYFNVASVSSTYSANLDVPISYSQVVNAVQEYGGTRLVNGSYFNSVIGGQSYDFNLYLGLPSQLLVTVSWVEERFENGVYQPVMRAINTTVPISSTIDGYRIVTTAHDGWADVVAGIDGFADVATSVAGVRMQ